MVNPSSQTRLWTRGKIYLTKNNKIIKADKKISDYLNKFFSSIVKNLDIRRYKIGYDSVVDNTTDPILKAILKFWKHPSIIAINDRYKGKDTFNFNEVHMTETKNQILQLNKRKAKQSYDIPTRIIIENADILSDVLCNNTATLYRQTFLSVLSLRTLHLCIKIMDHLIFCPIYQKLIKILFTQMTKFFETIFSRYQFGLRKSFSTQ